MPQIAKIIYGRR